MYRSMILRRVGELRGTIILAVATGLALTLAFNALLLIQEKLAWYARVGGAPFEGHVTFPWESVNALPVLVLLAIPFVAWVERGWLRTTLTVVGIIVAIAAFGLLRTIVDAWYAGANASSSARLVTRSAVSLVFALPLSYAQKIRQVQGVTSVAWANWFGGIYISERNFFAQFAISGASYLDVYPEFILWLPNRLFG